MKALFAALGIMGLFMAMTPDGKFLVEKLDTLPERQRCVLVVCLLSVSHICFMSWSWVLRGVKNFVVAYVF